MHKQNFMILSGR